VLYISPVCRLLKSWLKQMRMAGSLFHLIELQRLFWQQMHPAAFLTKLKITTGYFPFRSMVNPARVNEFETGGYGI
jgi:hypothetical protein